jgi:hypothetical protein
VRAGDKVVWDWLSIDFTNVKHGICQLESINSTSCMKGGFSSGAPVAKGRFVKAFGMPGTYYYGSPKYARIGMVGTVRVLGYESESGLIEVSAMQNKATFAQFDKSGFGSGSGSENVLSDSCLENNLALYSEANTYGFLSCLTPTITSVRVQLQQKFIKVSLAGTLFAETGNVVSVSGQPCKVFDEKTTSVTCRIDALPAGRHQVHLVKPGIGLAMHVDAVAVVVPRVFSISPKLASVAGGQPLTIRGHGFSSSTDDVVVGIGSTGCIIQSSTVTEIKCLTLASNSSSSSDKVEVHVANKDYVSLKSQEIAKNRVSESINPKVVTISWNRPTEKNITFFRQLITVFYPISKQ